MVDDSLRLVRALGWLKSHTGSRRDKLATVAAALAGPGDATDAEAMERMDLSQPRSAGDWLQARLLRLALHRTEPSCNHCHGVIDPLGHILYANRSAARMLGHPLDSSSAMIDAGGRRRSGGITTALGGSAGSRRSSSV